MKSGRHRRAPRYIISPTIPDSLHPAQSPCDTVQTVYSALSTMQQQIPVTDTFGAVRPVSAGAVRLILVQSSSYWCSPAHTGAVPIIPVQSGAVRFILVQSGTVRNILDQSSTVRNSRAVPIIPVRPGTVRSILVQSNTVRIIPVQSSTVRIRVVQFRAYRCSSVRPSAVGCRLSGAVGRGPVSGAGGSPDVPPPPALAETPYLMTFMATSWFLPSRSSRACPSSRFSSHHWYLSIRWASSSGLRTGTSSVRQRPAGWSDWWLYSTESTPAGRCGGRSAPNISYNNQQRHTG